MQSQSFLAVLLREVSAPKKTFEKALAELAFGDFGLMSVLSPPCRHPQLCSTETASALEMPSCSPLATEVAFPSHKEHVELLQSWQVRS